MYRLQTACHRELTTRVAENLTVANAQFHVKCTEPHEETIINVKFLTSLVQQDLKIEMPSLWSLPGLTFVVIDKMHWNKALATQAEQMVWFISASHHWEKHRIYDLTSKKPAKR